MRLLDLTTSLAATIVRAAAGIQAEAPSSRPASPLELYDFEA